MQYENNFPPTTVIITPTITYCFSANSWSSCNLNPWQTDILIFWSGSLKLFFFHISSFKFDFSVKNPIDGNMLTPTYIRLFGNWWERKIKEELIKCAVVVPGRYWHSSLSPAFYILTNWHHQEYTKLASSCCCLQCACGFADSHHWITLIRKPEMCWISGKFWSVFFSVISKQICRC